MTIDFTKTDVFDWNYEAKTRIVVNRGGTRSSKTYSLIQLFIIKALTEKNKKIVIVRKTHTRLLDTIKPEMMKFLEQTELNGLFRENKQMSTLTCIKTGTIIKFIGADDESKFKGLEANYFWFNEGDEIDYEFFKQAIRRLTGKTTKNEPNQFFIDFNPSARFSWIKTKIEDFRTDFTLIQSSYKNNDFLTEADIKEIEFAKEYDHNEWLVYGLGEYGDVRGAVFTNYSACDRIPEDAEFIGYGMDFGFSNDPTTLIAVHKYEGEIYLEEKIYHRGQTGTDLISMLQNIGVGPYQEIYADHSPAMIEEIRRKGFNIKKAPFKDIVLGIDIMKRYKINILHSSKNIMKEFNFYTWKTTSSGEELNEPIDKHNHAIDGIRYCMMAKLYEPKSNDVDIY